MIHALILASLLTLHDPVGDAFGNGNLLPPTDVVFRTPGVFDAQLLEVPDTPTFSIRLTMGRLNNPWELPYGFSLPIIEFYLDTGAEGEHNLLPGSGMSLPAGATWNYALRITGESLTVLVPGAEAGVPLDITDSVGARLSVEGDTIIVTTELPRPTRFSLFGMVGSYDFFDPTGWRPVLPEPTVGAFGSPSQQVRAIDILAEDVESQARAIDTGILPEIRPSVRRDGWLQLMGLGVLLALVGVVGRLLRSRPIQPKPPPASPPEAPEPQPVLALPPPLQPITTPALPPPSKVADDTALTVPDQSPPPGADGAPPHLAQEAHDWPFWEEEEDLTLKPKDERQS
ncbi:MAG: hypothetical protein KGZ60_05500 [Truepera sp.]|nr:hypothetical protein [Truepera sp.]